MAYVPNGSLGFPAPAGPLSALVPERYSASLIGTFAMATLNKGWCARFRSNTTKDIKAVKIAWTSVASAGAVLVRIETIDMTTGKPTGTLYDAAAAKTVTPTAGWQTVTFDTLPTTGLTSGAWYGVVVLTTTGGTTQTLASNFTNQGIGFWHHSLTATDGTSRTNFTEDDDNAYARTPIVTFVLDDDTEETFGCAPSYVEDTNRHIYGANYMAGVKFTVPFDCVVQGVQWHNVIDHDSSGFGDLRVRILDTSNVQITNATCTLDASMSYHIKGKRGSAWFDADVTLPAGTYRIVFDSASSPGLSEDWWLKSLAVPSAFVSTLMQPTYTSNGGTAWTEANAYAPIWLILDTVTESSAGGSYCAASDVRYGVDRGDSTLGTCYVPTAANTISGVNVDNTTGTYHECEVDEVADGVTFGPASAYTGTLTVSSPLTVDDVKGIRYRLQLDGTQVEPSASTGAINVNLSTINDELVETTGTPEVNVIEFAGQTVACAAGVTIGPYVGNATAAISVNASGQIIVSGFATGAITAAAFAQDSLALAAMADDYMEAIGTQVAGEMVTGTIAGVTGSVASVATGGITAASFASNAITAAKINADAITAIQAGLATANVKKNTEVANFMFALYSSSNHTTPITGRSVTLQKCIDNAAAFSTATNAVEEVGSGLYRTTLAAADLNGECVAFKASASGADTRFFVFLTQP